MPPMSATAKRTLAVVCLVGLVGAAVYAVWPPRPPAPPPDGPPASRTFPAPPFSETRFLNAGPDAQYIGSDSCAKCHTSNYKSYALTAHSKALSDVDPAAEPP